MLRITNGRIITPEAVRPELNLFIDQGVIAGMNTSDSVGDSVLDAQGLWVAPGMIDVHVHGSDGHDTMQATAEALHGMGRFFARHGVTSYYPTTVSAPGAAISAAIDNVRNTPQPVDGAQHLGVHIEGPYLSLDFPGAQPPDVLRPPDPVECLPWLESSVVKLMTIAPELDGMDRLIADALDHSVELALGHSGASYEQVVQAADRGVRQATHTYNGMLGLHHRKPGTLGGVLTEDRIYAQIIADGIHAHPAMVRLLLRAKGPQRTILITDAVAAAGLPDGDYQLDQQDIQVRNGVSRTLNGALAGSTVTMDKALRNMMAFCDSRGTWAMRSTMAFSVWRAAFRSH